MDINAIINGKINAGLTTLRLDLGGKLAELQARLEAERVEVYQHIGALTNRVQSLEAKVEALQRDTALAQNCAIDANTVRVNEVRELASRLQALASEVLELNGRVEAAGACAAHSHERLEAVANLLLSNKPAKSQCQNQTDPMTPCTCPLC